MPRPTSAELLAFQLEHAAADKAGRTSPLPMSAPPSSSFVASPKFPSSDSSAPSTPATPCLADADGEWRPEGRRKAQMDGNGEARGKLQSRGGTRTVQQDDDADETDDDLEDELNDFGFGAPKRRKEKKESLLDILNSDPPGWMPQPPETATVDPEPLAQPKRSATLSKFRARFGSIGPAPVVPATDSLVGLSTLRTSRSASNLLSSLRGRLGSGVNRSRDDFHDLPASASQSSLPYVMENGSSANLAHSDRLPARPQPAKKLAAKEASSASSSSTRDLADFLRSSGPPPAPHAEFGTLPHQPSSLSLGAKPRSTLHKQRPSFSKGLGLSTRSAHTAASSDAGSVDTSVSGTAILKAAMVKLGQGGRRASLTPLAKMGAPPGDGDGRAHRSGSGSSDGAGSGTIRVDDELVIGMFGAAGQHETTSVAPTATAGAHRRRASADAASIMGIAEFVSTDEERRDELERARLPVETRAGDLAERAAAGLRRGPSQRSSLSIGHFSPPRSTTPQRVARKPVPASIPPIEELLSAPTPPRSSSTTKTSPHGSSTTSLRPHDSAPLALEDDPQHADDQPEQPYSFQTLAPISPVSPLTPSTVYATPPVTPTPNVLDDPILAPYRTRTRARTRTSDSALSLSAAQSKRASVIAAATACPPSPAPQTPLPATPVERSREPSRASSSPSLSVIDSRREHRPPAITVGSVHMDELDALLNSPLAAHLAVDELVDRRTDRVSDSALLSALDELRACLRTTSTMPSTLGEVEPARDGDELARAVVPVLREMGEQMRRGARLVETVLALLEGVPQAVRTGEEGDGELARAAEAVLVGIDGPA
ncbi:hypothetical protein JCM8208_000192 [Rhodotorula glutinis]